MIKSNYKINKQIIIYFLTLFCIFMIPTEKVTPSSNVIENNKNGIPDKGLYQAILNELNKKPNQKFTKQEAEKMKVLNASFYDIESLKGIGYLKNLESLGLDGNNLKNLKGVQKLKNLKTLYAYGNRIKNLKALKNLKKLEFLDFHHNQLTSLKGIQNLKRLDSLNLEGNNLKSVSEIKNLKKLKYLDLSQNEITSLKDLKNLKKMVSLSISYNQISSLKGIEKLTNLEFLNARGNQLTKVKQLKKLKKLKRLYLNENQISSLAGIQKLVKLTYLNVSSNQLETIDGIQNLKKLDFLYAGRNRLTEIKEIEGLKKLRGLDVSYNRLVSLPDFTKNPKLNRIFNIAFNNLSLEEIQAKIPKNLVDDIEALLAVQNVNYTIEITEPVITNQISRETQIIKGHVYIPNAVILLMLKGDINDDDVGYRTFEAQSDENGNFVFDSLNFDKLDDKNFIHYIAFDIKYDYYGGDEYSYHDLGLRWYRIR